MKSFAKIVLALAALASASGALAQTSDSCLKLFCDGWHRTDSTTIEECENPDSVLIDTCVYHRYAYQWYEVRFQKVIFNIPGSTTEDSVITRTWEDIDTSETAIRLGFDSIESKFGTFIFQKLWPTVDDTSNLLSQIFKIKFNNYVDIDTAIAYLKLLVPSVSVVYENRAKILEAVATNNSASQITLSPSSSNRFFRIEGFAKLPKQILFFDAKGILLNRQITLQENDNSILVDCVSLSSGIYFVKIGNETFKFLLLK